MFKSCLARIKKANHENRTGSGLGFQILAFSHLLEIHAVKTNGVPMSELLPGFVRQDYDSRQLVR
jgi:hypothetical protein